MRKVLWPLLAVVSLVDCGASREAEVRTDVAPVRAFVARAISAPRVRASGFDLAAGRTFARLPSSSGAPVVLEGTSIAIAAPAAPAVVDGSTVTYAHDATRTSTWFSLPNGLEALVKGDGEAAFDLAPPPGGSVRRYDDVVAVTDAAGTPVLHVTADRAWDARGVEWPVAMKLEGARLSLRVDPKAMRPVVIDPTFSPTTSPLRLRRKHSATLLGSGEVLIAGGSGTSTAEIYDSFSGRFRVAASMTRVRAGHAARLLSDGRVLMVGGGGSSAEVYDPSTGSFAAIGSTSVAYGAAWITPIEGGKYIVTGTGAKADVFDPATNTFAPVSGTHPGGPAVRLANGDVLFLGNGLGAGTVGIRSSTTGTMTTVSGAPDVFAGDPVALPDGRVFISAVLARALYPDDSVFYMMGAWLFDPSSKTFTDAPAPAGGSTPRGVLLPTGKVALVNEFGMQTYDPAANAFVSYSYAFPNPRKAPTPTDRHGDHTTTLLPNGDVFVLGGDGSSEVLSFQDEYGSFELTQLGEVRVRTTATQLLDGRVLFSGGTGVPATTSPPVRSTAEVFDPSTKAVGALATMTEARVGHAAVLLNSGKVLLAGGTSSTAELFDPATNTSTKTGSMSVARPRASAVLLPGGKALVIGGNSSAELFDEATGTFTTTGPMLAPHPAGTLHLLPTGKVLVYDASGAELYDPSTGTFSSAGAPVGTSRDTQATATLATGEVIGIGGPSAAADVFDWRTSTFSLGAMVDEVRTDRKLATLANGKVLVVGGYNLTTGVSKINYAFDPLGAAGKGYFQTLAWPGTAVWQQPLIAVSTGGAVLTDGNPCAPACPYGLPTNAIVYHAFPPSAPRPVLTKAPAKVTPGGSVTIEGTSLVASLDGATHSSTASPVAIWVPASGKGQVMGTITNATATSATWRVPTTALFGKGFLHLATNGTLSKGIAVEIAAASNGTTCGNGAQCGSGFCVDGVCCDTACTGVCNACTKARKGSGDDGVCGAIPPEKDGKDECAISLGAPCTSGAQCGSGICADGVCCDSACTGSCEACNTLGNQGKCVPVVGKPSVGHPACDAGTDACSARLCDGVTRDSCAGHAPATTDCRAESCADGVATLAGKCDGAGKCEEPKTQKCEPFACGEGRCLDKCAVDGECAAGYRCVAGKCVTGAYCSDNRTVKNAGSPDVDCSPFVCEGDRCKTTCGSSNDCVGGFLCDNGQCVTPASPTVGDDGGGCTYGTRASHAGWLAALALGLGLVRRRTRR